MFTHDAKVKCEICGKISKNPPALSDHIRMVHTNRHRPRCDSCDSEFYTSATLRKHISTVTHLEKSTRRIFKCEFCLQTFLLKVYLQRHVRMVHENRGNRTCTFCDKRFSTSGNMRRHVEVTHPTSSEKLHSCDKCEYRSHSKVNLARHEKRHNSTNRRECYFCNKQFLYFSSLVTHGRRHTLEQ
ncbi:Myoneurin [Folsomia candida]|uniref:Myoneurin n=1 Tax=Folsomia candida TaxID=158441 RepID=A0A226DQF7_FOLCA|nr:Myoneurin [Folsomia candida]